MRLIENEGKSQIEMVYDGAMLRDSSVSEAREYYKNFIVNGSKSGDTERYCVVYGTRVFWTGHHKDYMETYFTDNLSRAEFALKKFIKDYMDGAHTYIKNSMQEFDKYMERAEEGAEEDYPDDPERQLGRLRYMFNKVGDWGTPTESLSSMDIRVFLYLYDLEAGEILQKYTTHNPHSRKNKENLTISYTEPEVVPYDG